MEPRPGGLARGSRIVVGERTRCNGLGNGPARFVSRRQRFSPDPRAMTDARKPTSAHHEGTQPDTAADVDPDVAQLLGLRPADADPIPSADEIDTLGEMTDTRVYQGDLEARPPGSDQPDQGQAANLESLAATELREGETDDPNEAAEEGFAWIPPIDPPLRVEDDGPEVAAGFGLTAQDEPFDEDHHSDSVPARDEVEQRIWEALRADAATTGLADRVEFDVEGGVVRVVGVVEDLDDEDAILGVIEGVPGVRIVDSRVTVAAVEQVSLDRS